MADQKLTELTELTSLTDDDLFYVVDDPAGTPLDRKVTRANLISNIAVADLANGTDGELITWDAAGAPTTVAVGTASQVLTSNGVGAAPTFQGISNIDIAEIASGSSLIEASILLVIDGGGSAITTGVKGYIEVPFDCSIQSVRMLADVSGSAVVDIWKDTYANYPPTDADSITASAVPTISASIKSEDATLTGWTTTVSKGDMLGFNVDSASTITKLTVSLLVNRT